MKRFKLLNVLTIIIILLAVVPPEKVQAHIEISSNTTISNNVTWVTDIVVTNGATLTIAPDVTVMVNCSDSHIPYATGKDPNKIELIIEDGTLIADRVIFKGAEANSCWYGIEVLDLGDAKITRSTIRDVRVGITVDKSGAEISGNTIRSVWGLPDASDLNHRHAEGIYVVDGEDGIIIENNTITGVQGGDAPDNILPLLGGIAYGIHVIRTNNVTIEGNKIEYISGGDAGEWTADALDGTDGGDGVDFDNQNPTPGANGAHGSAGGSGGNAFGVFAQSVDVKTISLLDNTITDIYGGNGSRGQLGGDGGDGGDANYQVLVNATDDAPKDGIPGGAGGNGGNGGAGGNGGTAHGVWLSKMNATIIGNQIIGLIGGEAGVGNLGGSGGAGGNGGKGSNFYYDLTPEERLVAGYGGPGGVGGNGGPTGTSGNGGSAIGVYFSGADLMSFSQNTISNVSGRLGGLGNMGAGGGMGGVGGSGGIGLVSYPFGGGGGAGGAAGQGGPAGNGGNGGSAYGLWINDSTISSIESNAISKIVSGIGLYGGNGGIGQSGGVGGGVGQYPNESDSNLKGGVGGVGGAAGRGGNGGMAGFAYGIYATLANGSPTVVNNLIYDIYAPSGGEGGDGGAGGVGGRGGSGDAVAGVDQPGGDGGNGGAAGNGGDGGDNVPGTSLFNASAFFLSSASTSTSSWLVTNNSLVNISSNNSNPEKGLKGTPGLGGAGGNGSPAGSTGDPGAVGSDGLPGVKGQTGGYYSGPYVTSDLYNNIIAYLATAPLSNSVGLFKGLDGSVSGFRYGDVFGWQKNYGDSIATIDKTGSISASPLFVDFTTEDYHLQLSSPCVDAGLDTAPGVPSVDIEATSRPLGVQIDMGAYEFVPSGEIGFSIFLPLMTK